MRERFQVNLVLVLDFNMGRKFYLMSQRGANKYLWLHWKKEVNEKSPSFIEEVKEGRGIFKRYSGTTGAEIIGGSPVLNFYSGEFIKFLCNHGVKLKFWQIKIELSEKDKKKIKLPIQVYYYIEPLSYIKFMSDGTYKSKVERDKNTQIIEKWKKDNNLIYFEGDEWTKCFYNISNWDGSDLFGVESYGKKGQIIVVTENLKKIIEKAKLKNIAFKELKVLRGDQNESK